MRLVKEIIQEKEIIQDDGIPGVQVVVQRVYSDNGFECYAGTQLSSWDSIHEARKELRKAAQKYMDRVQTSGIA